MKGSNWANENSKCQMHGLLSKRPFGHQSSKWNKRFFVVKDGFLLYYPESEKKEFDKSRFFNIHPKAQLFVRCISKSTHQKYGNVSGGGVIPLGGSDVNTSSEAAQPFCIHITSEDFNGNLLLAAESEYEQDKWINILRQSSRVNWRNAQLGDAMIEQLEGQGLQMAQEKQGYFDKLQNEAMALHDEKLRTEELEKINDELHKERAKMEQFALELKEEYNKIKVELSDTLLAMKSVEEDKLMIHKTTADLQSKLEELELEKNKTILNLQKHQSETHKLSQEKHNLSTEREILQKRLADIETKTKSLLNEQASAATRLKEAISRARTLEEDKRSMREHAEELKASIKEIAAQKAVTESELKEEVMARLEAERRLQTAEHSLGRLECAVQHQGDPGRDTDEVKEEMLGDVNTLKHFFENLAFEANLDADKSVMIKNSIHARKKMVRRAKTMKYEATRSRKSRGSSTSTCSSLMSPVPLSPCSPLMTADDMFFNQSSSSDTATSMPTEAVGVRHSFLV